LIDQSPAVIPGLPANWTAAAFLARLPPQKIAALAAARTASAAHRLCGSSREAAVAAPPFAVVFAAADPAGSSALTDAVLAVSGEVTVLSVTSSCWSRFD
jgi:hypothetical protein